jgi:AcrR family transcriptional regulator
MSKTGLYYYFASKELLIFDLMFGVWQTQGERIRDAVEVVDTGPAALAAIIRNTVEGFAPRMDDFRLAFLFGQVSSSSGLQVSPEQFDRIRPLNNMILGGAAQKLAAESRRNAVEPRLLAFLAHVSALGLLTMKGLVESQGDPLLYSDEQLIEGLSQVFAAAAG